MPNRNMNRLKTLGFGPLLVAALAACSSPQEDLTPVVTNPTSGVSGNPTVGAPSGVPSAQGTTPTPVPTQSNGVPLPTATNGMPPAPTSTDGTVVPPNPSTTGVPPAPSSTDGTMPSASVPPVVVPPPAGRTCPVVEGLIADFEEGSVAVLPVEDRLGKWEGFGDAAGTLTEGIVEEGTDACNKGVFHISGSGFEEYVGLGTTVASSGLVMRDGKEEYAPVAYDAVAKGFVGISFRAKAGAMQATPVRFALSHPWTEGAPYGNEYCENSYDVEDTNKPCWNHLGHFMIDDEALTTEWKTYTFCFDRDLHPEWLPSGGTTAERQGAGKALLGVQFKFNQAVDPATYPSTVDDAVVERTEPFDFYLDDVKFVKSGCDKPIFASTGGATDAFGTNAKIGTCNTVTNAPAYNRAISEAYTTWKRLYVRNDGGVIDPQEGTRVVSEAIGYGMMIAAAMGDKETFDAIWGWASPKLQGGLLGWQDGGGGSATDADTDMAYALLMAGKQWGGTYAASGNAIASQALTKDVNGNGVLGAGEMYLTRLNPSYYSPGFYRAYSSNWGSVVTATEGALSTCSAAFGGLLPDWCSLSGQPDGAGSAQQTAQEICPTGTACMAFDGARIPWRLGFDACTGGTAASKALLTSLMSNLFSKGGVENGDRIDLITAGWTAAGPTSGAVANSSAFLGPVGVGAMGIGDQEALDRAFIATLDIMERPEYYGTYFQQTVGMLSVLMMSGNWPMP
jgi:endo-1,4-beta-D-glucanase Y